MKEKIELIKNEGLKEINESNTIEELEVIKKRLLGKNSSLKEILGGISKLTSEEKKEIGLLAGKTKELFEQAILHKSNDLLQDLSVLRAPLDTTRPGIKKPIGTLNPLTVMTNELNEAFLSLGFKVVKPLDITSELFEFDNLNFRSDHPAREMMDTYWLEGTESLTGKDRHCLRPHLTGVSSRFMKEFGAPFKIVYPSNVFRNEDVDAGHERNFYQYEALIVDEDITFSQGKILIETILEKIFGEKINIRMREGFFPFVEPGFEIDMECQICHGKGCSVCKHNGWLEVMPGGIVHPNVLRNSNIDPEKYTGFYINIGLERMIMMRYKIDDVRLFRSADLRFLEQFK